METALPFLFFVRLRPPPFVFYDRGSQWIAERQKGTLL